MKTRGDFRKFLTIAIAIGVLAGAGGKPAFAKDRHLSNAGRPAAIHDCNIEANKYSPINLQFTEPAWSTMGSGLVSGVRAGRQPPAGAFN